MREAAHILPTIFGVELKCYCIFRHEPQPGLPIATGCNFLLGNLEETAAEA